MRLGIYVGSFDPVHKGHKKVIDHLINNNYVDSVIAIVTGNYWDKKQMTSLNDRINMLKKYESKKIIINETLNNLEYTYQILNALKNEYPNDTLYLIIGADNIPKFNLWKNVNDILKNKILILPRNNINIEQYIKEYKEAENFIPVKDFTMINVSSTTIRENINNDLTEYLDKEIIDYIKKNNLYGG